MPKLADHTIPLGERLKRSKDKYENKRVVKNVSFNTASEDQTSLYELTKKFNFSEWVKKILAAFNVFEVKQLVKGEITIPTILIEDAIKNGQFDIVEYLESQGKKIVDINSPNVVPSQQIQYDEFNQDFEYSQDVEYSTTHKVH